MRPNQATHPTQICDDVQELLPDYAFGLTDADDTNLVESGLADCPEAVGELADFHRLQDEMRASVPQIVPPAHLEDQLMAAITAPHPRVVKPRRMHIASRRVWLAVAAAVIALVGTNVYWMLRVDDLARRQNELAEQMMGQQNSAFVLTGTSDLRWVRLPPSQQNGDASAFMMWNKESQIGLLYARGFPRLAIGNTYQLWLTRGDERISAGTFRVDEEGKGALLFHITDAIDKYTWARITAEPQNGSNQPSDTVIVNGKLSA